MKRIITPIFLLLSIAANAAVVFTQPPTGSGGLLLSSWWSPNGSDYDQYVWDNFSVSSNLPVTEVKWRGGFAYGGSGGAVVGFTISFYFSIGGGSQPNVVWLHHWRLTT